MPRTPPWARITPSFPETPLGRIPDDIAFISLPQVLAEFHHLPEHVPVPAALAEAAREKGYPFAEGVKAMERVLEADPAVPGSYLFRLFVAKWPKWKEAEGMLAAGRLAEAIQVLVGILETDPDCPLTCFQLGFCFRATGELEKSESFYRKALTLAPDVGWIHSNLGRTYQAMIDPVRAAEAYWTALEKLPNDLFVIEQLEALGEIVAVPDREAKPGERSYMKREDYRRALEARLAATEDPAEFLKAGHEALRGRQWEPAATCFEKAREAAKRQEQTDEAELGLGIACLHAGRIEEAERWLVGFLDRVPGSVVGHVNLFKVYLKTDDLERAWEEIRTAATLAPDDLDVLQQMFLFFENNGREEEGLEALRELEARAPGAVAPLLLQAQHHDAKGDWALAETLLKRALKRSPGSEAVLSYYSAALGRLGRPKEAAALLAPLRPTLTFALAVNLALAMRQAGDRTGSLDVLREFKDRRDVPALDRMRAEVLMNEFGKEKT
jgi:tetratricopeptide (TPR) repeat protein